MAPTIDEGAMAAEETIDEGLVEVVDSPDTRTAQQEFQEGTAD